MGRIKFMNATRSTRDDAAANGAGEDEEADKSGCGRIFDPHNEALLSVSANFTNVQNKLTFGNAELTR